MSRTENGKQQEILAKHKEYLFSCVANYYEEPLVVDRAKDSLVYDVDGREYLDFFGGIVTISVGHCNDRVVAAIEEQVRKVQHTSALYPTEPHVRLAEKLAAITPGALKQSFFTNSGTEANETAVLVAQLYTRAQDIVALRHSYSGRTQLAMSLTGNYAWRLTPTSSPNVHHIPNAYCYRCPFGLTYPSCDLKCAKDLESAIQTATSGKLAAFIAEPIQGVGGFITPPKEYFKEVAAIVHKYGGLFICDEVQTGWGRTGGKMFGIEQWDAEPDIMTFAKGMANGVPIGGTITRPEVAGSVKGLSLSTFGGNPVTCAAALATIEVIENDGLVANAAERGRQLRDGLEALGEKYPLIGDIRGMGLMQGIEMVGPDKTPSPEAVARLFELTKRNGLLIGKGGLMGNVIRITPALNVTKEHVDEALDRLDRSLAQMGL
ncbi:MAG: aspartate aminotransferase family protein [Deltaproteobacteria bacterium]|nr:aspartate aminotransferase family protein [Deltaproteobacteria bacterium]